MNIDAKRVADSHDIRLNLFLGLANWSLFLDHIPNDVVNRITARNYGFSGASDLFIFISGYTAAIIYAKIMLERGFIIGATRIIKQLAHLYAAYIVLFVTYIAAIGYVAAQYSAPDILNEFNIAGIVDQPIRILAHGLLLQAKPLNLDVLQLYVMMTAILVPVMWLLLRAPDLTMAESVALYLAARWFEWNLSSFPDGDWYFNPFCWQLLFVLGGWLALGGARRLAPMLKSPFFLYAGVAYLIFALAMTMAARFPDFGRIFPAWLVDAFNPNDKVNLAPYRLLHFLVLAFIVTRFVRKDSPALKSPIFNPLIKCGEQSLAVFCVGVLLSFLGNFALTLSAGSLIEQILVSISGIACMTFVAYYVSWSKQQDVWKAAAAPHPQAGPHRGLDTRVPDAGVAVGVVSHGVFEPKPVPDPIEVDAGSLNETATKQNRRARL
ncbi:OpgC domain-containing protein [Bradyrhizobium sp. dw_78]|uniref:OpgC domain-containing protein n=1 Tax=Bradyrhizobium sp. dw_78 TaxID=2719793 RepID=UPI001BD2F966|nr:OpgC domain-containing protein [Bradyrhizobium sp. dw_78]